MRKLAVVSAVFLFAVSAAVGYGVLVNRSLEQTATLPSSQAAPVVSALSRQLPVSEGSGMVASKQYPGVFWWNRDGGDATATKPRLALYAVKFDANGNQQPVRDGDYAPYNMVTNAQNTNWEDIAIDSSNNIWLGDIGANKCGGVQDLYKVPEPNPNTSNSVAATAHYTFTFPDPAVDCTTWNSEAMLWLDGKLYIFAKTNSSPVYRIDLPSGSSGKATLVKLGQLTGGINNISVSSVSSDKKRLLVATHQKLWVYKTTANLSGDALIKDLIGRAPAYQADFNCNCELGKGTVEGGTFVHNSYDVTFVAEGRQQYYAKASQYGDGGGTTTPPPPTPDTTQPTASITSPSGGSTVSGIITVSASASDNVGVTKVDFSIDGTIFATDTSSPYSVSWDSKTVANGSHTLRAKAWDAAGNAKTPAVAISVNNAAAPPNITGFSANPSSITAGSSTTLSWSTLNVTTCSVTPGGPQNTSAKSWTTLAISTIGTKTYTVTCQNADGQTTTRSVSVSVNPAPQPPSNVVLTASKTSVLSGSSVVLSWSSSGSTSCTLNPGNYAASGGSSSKTVANLTATTTFQVTCNNAAGSSKSGEVVVSVTTAPSPPPKPVITNFSAAPSSVDYGATSLLSWQTSNVVAGGCALAPSVNTSTSASGSWRTPALETSISYTLTCKNSANDTASKSVAIVVGDKPAPPPPPPVDPSDIPAPPPSDTTNPTIVTPSGEEVVNTQETAIVTQGQRAAIDTSTVTNKAKISSIVKVEFYSGEELIATLSEAPYVLDTANLGAGEYTITQRTYYDDGSVSEQSQLIEVQGAQATNAANALRGQTTAIAGSVVGVLAIALGFVWFWVLRPQGYTLRGVVANSGSAIKNMVPHRKSSTPQQPTDYDAVQVIHPDKKDPPAN